MKIKQINQLSLFKRDAQITSQVVATMVGDYFETLTSEITTGTKLVSAGVSDCRADLVANNMLIEVKSGSQKIIFTERQWNNYKDYAVKYNNVNIWFFIYSYKKKTLTSFTEPIEIYQYLSYNINHLVCINYSIMLKWFNKLNPKWIVWNSPKFECSNKVFCIPHTFIRNEVNDWNKKTIGDTIIEGIKVCSFDRYYLDDIGVFNNNEKYNQPPPEYIEDKKEQLPF